MHPTWTSTVFFAVLGLAIRQSRGDIRITKHGHQEEVREHGSLTLECRSTTSHVTWSFEGSRLTNDTGKYRILEEPDRGGSGLVSRLVIANVEPDDAGNYACFCTRSGFKDEINVKVIGHEHHRRVSIDGPKRLEFEVGSELTLICKADSHSAVGWFFNSSPVSNSTRDKVTSTMDDSSNRKVVVLVRKNFGAKDFGLYRCQNADDVSDKSVVELVLKGGSGGTSNRNFQRNDMSVLGVAVLTFISMLIAI